MMYQCLSVLGIIVLLFMSGCAEQQTKQPIVRINAEDREISVAVEIADDESERARGLMYRESLEPYAGMLFVWNDSSRRTFWMKNTLIPLDMIFINEDGAIVTIHHADPCTSDPCPTYSSDKNAKFVLEVNKGFAQSHGIDEGDLVELIWH